MRCFVLRTCTTRPARRAFLGRLVRYREVAHDVLLVGSVVVNTYLLIQVLGVFEAYARA